MAIALVVASPWLVPMEPALADTTTAVAGACTVELTISGVPALPGTASTLGVTGDGDCVVNGEDDHTIGINGSLVGPSTWTCAGGVAEGQLTFTVSHPKFVSAVVARVVLTVGGGAAGIVALEDTANPAFAGAGAFVRDAGSVASCVVPPPSMTFCGTFGFVRGNPVPPVPS